MDDETLFGTLDLLMGGLPRVMNCTSRYRWCGGRYAAFYEADKFRIEDAIVELTALPIKEAETRALDYMLARKLAILAK